MWPSLLYMYTTAYDLKQCSLLLCPRPYLPISMRLPTALAGAPPYSNARDSSGSTLRTATGSGMAGTIAGSFLKNMSFSALSFTAEDNNGSCSKPSNSATWWKVELIAGPTALVCCISTCVCYQLASHSNPRASVCSVVSILRTLQTEVLGKAVF